MSKRCKYIIGIVILILLALVAIWIKKNRMYLNYIPEEKIVHTDGFYEVQDMFLYEGDYVFGVSYETDSDDATISLASENTMNEDGTVGVVLFEGKLDPNENSIRIEADVTKNLYHVYLRVTDDAKITEIVERNEKTYNDPIIFYVLLILLVVLVICGRKKLSEDSFETIVYLGVLTALSMIPYMNDFLPDSHDINFHLTRISGIAHAFKCGQFPVKINTIQDWGFGYASSTMYPQLFLVVPVGFRLLGMSLLNCYKMLMLSIQLMTAIVSYLSFKGMFKNTTIAKMGVALYMFSMYRLDNLYVRGDVGESLAFVFLPLVVWGAYEIFYRDYKKWILLALGMTGEMECHIISTEIYTIALAVVFVFSLIFMNERGRRTVATIKAAVVMLLLNAGFIIPFIQYYFEGFVSTGTMGLYLQDQTEYLSQMFVQFSHYLGKGNMVRGTTQNEMSLTIGVIPLIGIALYFVITKVYKDRINEDESLKETLSIARGSMIMFTIFTICSLWIIPWDIMPSNPIIDTIAYPIYFFWRLIGIVQFFACLYICATIKVWIKFEPNKRILITALSIIIAVVMGWPAIDAMTQFPTKPNAESIANMNATDFNYFYMDSSFDELMARGEIVNVSSDDMTVRRYNKDELHVNTEIGLGDANDAYVEVPLYYYPGYKASVNGASADVLRGDNGIIRVPLGNIDGSTAVVDVKFVQPVLWRVAQIISVLTGIGLISYLTFRNRREQA